MVRFRGKIARRQWTAEYGSIRLRLGEAAVVLRLTIDSEDFVFISLTKKVPHTRVEYFAR